MQELALKKEAELQKRAAKVFLLSPRGAPQRCTQPQPFTLKTAAKVCTALGQPSAQCQAVAQPSWSEQGVECNHALGARHAEAVGIVTRTADMLQCEWSKTFWSAVMLAGVELHECRVCVVQDKSTAMLLQQACSFQPQTVERSVSVQLANLRTQPTPTG